MVFPQPSLAVLVPFTLHDKPLPSLYIKQHWPSTLTHLLTVCPYLKFCLFSPSAHQKLSQLRSHLSVNSHIGSVPPLSDESCRSGWHLLGLILLLYSLWLLTFHEFPHFSCSLSYIGSLEARILFSTILMSQITSWNINLCAFVFLLSLQVTSPS